MLNIFNTIISILTKNDIGYSKFTHEEVFNSEDVINNLATDILYESKSIALDVQGDIFIFTIPIKERLSIDKISKIIHYNKINLLQIEKMQTILGVLQGAVAPFGYNSNVHCYISTYFLNSSFFNFSPGLLDTTIQIKSVDIIKLSKIGVIKFMD